MSRTRYARSGRLRIAYELRGRRLGRRPWLALIPGMGFDRSGWQPVLRKLRRRFRVVLVDNRGPGKATRRTARSGSPTWPATSWPCSMTRGSARPTCWA